MKISIYFLFISTFIFAQNYDSYKLSSYYTFKTARLKNDGSVKIKDKKQEMQLVFYGTSIQVYRVTLNYRTQYGRGYIYAYYYRDINDDYAVAIINTTIGKGKGYYSFLLKQLQNYYKEKCPKLVNAIKNKTFKPDGIEVISAVQFYDWNCVLPQSQ